MEPGYICLYFKQSAPDCTISPTQMRKSCSLLKSVEKRFLMYGFARTRTEMDRGSIPSGNYKRLIADIAQKARYFEVSN